MTVQSVNNQYVIQIEQSSISLNELQKMLDYLRFKDIVAKSQATDNDIERLATDINRSGWQKIQNSLLERINK
jgi:hypothetical protein